MADKLTEGVAQAVEFKRGFTVGRRAGNGRLNALFQFGREALVGIQPQYPFGVDIGVGAVALGGAGAILVTAIWTVLFPELKRAKSFAPQYRNQEQGP